MKKKAVAMLMAAMMVTGVYAPVSAEAETTTETQAETEEKTEEEKSALTDEEIDELFAMAEYDPEENYDKYTVVDYTIESISAELICTISAKEDDSEFYLHTFWYGVEDHSLTKYDGKEFEVVEDESGFLSVDTPEILKIAIEQNAWRPIGEESAEATDDVKAGDDAKPAESALTEEEINALFDMAEYDPEKGYDKYTVVDYTIESISAELICTISAKEDDSEFYLHTFWYGVEDHSLTKYDGKEFEVVEDESGFLSVDTPEILKIALEQNAWRPIEE